MKNIIAFLVPLCFLFSCAETPNLTPEDTATMNFRRWMSTYRDYIPEDSVALISPDSAFMSIGHLANMNYEYWNNTYKEPLYNIRSDIYAAKSSVKLWKDNKDSPQYKSANNKYNGLIQSEKELKKKQDIFIDSLKQISRNIDKTEFIGWQFECEWGMKFLSNGTIRTEGHPLLLYSKDGATLLYSTDLSHEYGQKSILEFMELIK